MTGVDLLPLIEKELKLTPIQAKNYNLKATDKKVTVNNKKYKLYSHDNKTYFLAITKDGKTYKVSSEILDPKEEDKFLGIYASELDTAAANAGTKYVSHPLNLSEGQIKSIIDAIKNKEPTVLRLKKESFINGSVNLPLNKSDQLSVQKNKAFYYSFNKSKIKLMKVEEGGFLPIILGGLAALAGLTSAGTAIANSVINKKI